MYLSLLLCRNFDQNQILNFQGISKEHFFLSFELLFTHNNYTRLLRMNETTLTCCNFTSFQNFDISPFQILMMIRVQCQVRSALVDFLLWRRGPGQMVLRKKLLTLTGPAAMTATMKRYLQIFFSIFSFFQFFFQYFLQSIQDDDADEEYDSVPDRFERLTSSQVLPWGAPKERARFPSNVNIETDIRPGEFVMRTLFAEFTIQVST